MVSVAGFHLIRDSEQRVGGDLAGSQVLQKIILEQLNLLKGWAGPSLMDDTTGICITKGALARALAKVFEPFSGRAHGEVLR